MRRSFSISYGNSYELLRLWKILSDISRCGAYLGSLLWKLIDMILLSIDSRILWEMRRLFRISYNSFLRHLEDCQLLLILILENSTGYGICLYRRHKKKF